MLVNPHSWRKLYMSWNIETKWWKICHINLSTQTKTPTTSIGSVLGWTISAICWGSLILRHVHISYGFIRLLQSFHAECHILKSWYLYIYIYLIYTSIYSLSWTSPSPFSSEVLRLVPAGLLPGGPCLRGSTWPVLMLLWDPYKWAKINR